MPAYPAAHLTIDDVELLVVFAEPEASRNIERSVARAGLKGNVVLMWRDAEGCTQFMAPPEQHAFFQIVGYQQLFAQVNYRLECE